MSIDFSTLLNMEQNHSTADSVLEAFLVLKFKTFSFQDPDKISDGLSHIWEEPHKWQKIAAYMGKSENDTKNELKNIVLRRNQIAHEGDYLFHSGSREIIERTDTIEVMNFIQQLGTAIYNLVK